MNDASHAPLRRRKVWVLFLLALAGLVALLRIDVGRHLLFGWFYFLIDKLPAVTLNGVSLGVASVAVFLFVMILHLFLRKWLKGRAGSGDSDGVWKLRRTVAVAALVLLAFASGTALVGIAHQVVWLATSQRKIHDDFVYYVPQAIPLAQRQEKERNMKWMGLAGHTFAGTYNQYIVDPSGNHSWATRLVPFLNYYSKDLDFDKPWSHPQHGKVFGSVIREFINPELARADLVRDKDGWGLNHYALNSHIASSRGKWGSSNLLVIGEVNDGFQPWGKPGNWRDPMLGINNSPGGFGGSSGKGAHFVMGDGSVRFMAADVDPSVLEKLGR